MIRFDQRNFDVHETERLFKKVIHPTHGHNTIGLVDKDGIPLRSPNSAALSRLQSSYVLTPRGVPARKSTHSYSGQMTKDKLRNLVNTMDTNSHDIASFASSIHNYGLSSAGSSRHYIPVSLTSKKRTFGSGPPRSVKPMAKSASSERTRYLTMTPDESLILDENDEKWNGSPQGKRLEKEWSALSQCRALKRSSEIVSHRVDRMYFMTGNKLKLQQKFHVEDDELEHLKELSQARATARSARCANTNENDDPNLDKASPSTSYDTKQSMSYDAKDERLEKIERKLSRIERRLSFIEETREEEKNRKRIFFKEPPSDGFSASMSTSLESGIQEDVTVMTDGSHLDRDLMEQPNLDKYITNGSEPQVEAFSDKTQAETLSVHTHKTAETEKEMSDWPLRKITVTAIAGKKLNEPVVVKDPEEKRDPGIRMWDILTHDKGMTSAETMLDLLRAYPDIHERTRRAWENSKFDTATALTLGVPRKIREAKARSPKKQRKSVYFPCNEIVPPSKFQPNVPLKSDFIPSASKTDHVCTIKHVHMANSNLQHEAPLIKPEFIDPTSKKKDHLQKKFPTRKVRKFVTGKPAPPTVVDCDCRQDPRKSKGPLLTVQGTQLPLLDRDCLMCT